MVGKEYPQTAIRINDYIKYLEALSAETRTEGALKETAKEDEGKNPAGRDGAGTSTSYSGSDSAKVSKDALQRLREKVAQIIGIHSNCIAQANEGYLSKVWAAEFPDFPDKQFCSIIQELQKMVAEIAAESPSQESSAEGREAPSRTERREA